MEPNGTASAGINLMDFYPNALAGGTSEWTWKVMLIVGGLGLVAHVIAFGVVAYLFQAYVKRVPREHREVGPASGWFLLIPGFTAIWNFYVFLGGARSFQNYFQAHGRPRAGGTSYTMAMLYSVVYLFATGLIPLGFASLGFLYFGGLLLMAAFVLLIIVLVGFNDLQDRISSDVATG